MNKLDLSLAVDALINTVLGVVALVTNGGFDQDSDWTGVNGTTVAITGGKLVYSTPGVSTTVFQDIDITAGNTYECTFTISDYVLGTARLSLGGTLAPNRFANGTYTETIVAGATNSRIAIVCNNNADFKIDDVSVVPV